MKRLGILLLVSALLLVACQKPESYEDAASLVRALDQAGFTCHDDPVRPETGPATSVFGSALTCDLAEAGETTFVTFTDDAQKEQWLSFVSTFSGEVVTGANWGIVTQDRDAAQEMAEALGGEIDG